MEKYSKNKVLYVDDEQENLDSFKLLFLTHYQIITANSGAEGLEKLKEHNTSDQPITLVLSDQRMPQMSGVDFLEIVKQEYPEVIKILITGYSDIDVVAYALNNVEIFHYINKPYEYDYLKNIIDKGLDTYNLQRENQSLIQNLKNANVNLEKTNLELKEALFDLEKLKNRLQEENTYLKKEIASENNFSEIITRSNKLKSIFKEVESVAKTDSTVLVLGETGTGKELVAQAIHNASNRKNKTLVKVNCAAIPANLIESELFGHEKGAFTGAIARKIGRFELADGGTIFLDEIGEFPIDLQAKLLRVLQESELERLGNPRTIKINVRVIAATNRDLLKEVEKGNFREDLYYRLNVFPIQIPPLRARKEDVGILTEFFVQKYTHKTGKKIDQIPKRVLEKLEKYGWPGNVRELENIIERAVIITSGNVLQVGDWIDTKRKVKDEEWLIPLEEMEKKHIIETLKYCNGVIHGPSGAAEILKINASTLRSRMKKLGIRSEKKYGDI